MQPSKQPPNTGVTTRSANRQRNRRQPAPAPIFKPVELRGIQPPVALHRPTPQYQQTIVNEPNPDTGPASPLYSQQSSEEHLTTESRPTIGTLMQHATEQKTLGSSTPPEQMDESNKEKAATASLSPEQNDEMNEEIPATASLIPEQMDELDKEKPATSSPPPEQMTQSSEKTPTQSTLSPEQIQQSDKESAQGPSPGPAYERQRPEPPQAQPPVYMQHPPYIYVSVPTTQQNTGTEHTQQSNNGRVGLHPASAYERQRPTSLPVQPPMVMLSHPPYGYYSGCVPAPPLNTPIERPQHYNDERIYGLPPRPVYDMQRPAPLPIQPPMLMMSSPPYRYCNVAPAQNTPTGYYDYSCNVGPQVYPEPVMYPMHYGCPYCVPTPAPPMVEMPRVCIYCHQTVCQCHRGCPYKLPRRRKFGGYIYSTF